MWNQSTKEINYDLYILQKRKKNPFAALIIYYKDGHVLKKVKKKNPFVALIISWRWSCFPPSISQ